MDIIVCHWKGFTLILRHWICLELQCFNLRSYSVSNALYQHNNLLFRISISCAPVDFHCIVMSPDLSKYVYHCLFTCFKTKSIHSFFTYFVKFKFNRHDSSPFEKLYPPSKLQLDCICITCHTARHLTISVWGPSFDWRLSLSWTPLAKFTAVVNTFLFYL